MNSKILLGLLIGLMACSCKQQITLKSGLLIDNSINRGINYTDPQGMDHSIRYIPITITNDSTVSIHVQIAFSKEYNYPHPHSEQQFKLIPLPLEWARDGADISESMIDELPAYIENPILKETIEPGENMVLAIGSLYPRPAKTSGVLPRLLFAQSDTTTFPGCDWLMGKKPSSNQQIPLGLKIISGEKCMIIPCGEISYPKH
ncbi:MAG: hypothetical protein DWQ02_20140 [Bacteroidetes bacterium]|nr:MAG: hypothetical protein DWQ02_20140 [Bacteroidota bacterium]